MTSRVRRTMSDKVPCHTSILRAATRLLLLRCHMSTAPPMATQQESVAAAASCHSLPIQSPAGRGKHAAARARRLLDEIRPQVRSPERVHAMPCVAHHEAAIEVVVLAGIHHEAHEIALARL